FLSNYKKTSAKLIAIAPLSAHKLKEFPAESMKPVIKELSKKNIELFFLGSAKEKSILSDYSEGLHINNVAGQFTFEEELAFIAELDLVLTMDSANLHIAAGLGVKTVSIWGPTHRFTGFGPPEHKNHVCISIEELECRPCSVFGEKECYRGDFACMNQIKPKTVIDAIMKML
ncbi:MAG: glycosyltransferase family 9 protein, partial [Leptospirales bacterium]